MIPVVDARPHDWAMGDAICVKASSFFKTFSCAVLNEWSHTHTHTHNV